MLLTAWPDPGVSFVLQVGTELLDSRLQAQEDIQAELWGLNSQWKELNCKVAECGNQLRQAHWQDQLLGLLQVPWGGDWAQEGDRGQITTGWERAGWRVAGKSRRLCCY